MARSYPPPPRTFYPLGDVMWQPPHQEFFSHFDAMPFPWTMRQHEGCSNLAPITFS